MTQEQDRPGQELRSGTEDAPRVLLVDDAAAIRDALRGVLEDAGIEVVGEALDGIQGVAMAASLRPDVVLMDLRMPSSDGFEATAQIVSELPGVRVVVLSAYESEESAEAWTSATWSPARPAMSARRRPMVPSTASIQGCWVSQ